VSAAMQILDQLSRQGVTPVGLSVDSRRVGAGEVFLAYPGARVDGREFIAQAVANGAAAVLAESAGDASVAATRVGAGMTAVPVIEVKNLAACSGEIAHLVYGRPSEHLWLVGITGTNGKTSVSQWIAQMMAKLGHSCAVIGTLGNGFAGALSPSVNTTPDAVSLHAALARYREQGAVACAMEVSSIGLDQGRTNAAQFDIAVFTNLTRDHLDYHGSMANYAAAKRKLFDSALLDTAVLNLDDEFGRQLASQLKGRGRVRTIGYSLEGRTGADEVLDAENLKAGARGVEFDLGTQHFSVPVVGRFNASNVLAVIGALRARGEALVDLARVLPHIAPPPGRMQLLGAINEPLVVVDYAHTPDALEKVLTSVRDTATARGGKLICVFGCGGDRDPGKRPEMGAAAERHADEVWVTSDNPRSEAPQVIADMIVAGMASDPKLVLDRTAAIEQVIAEAGSNDVIVVAGKGHEPYQEIAGVRHPYSDISAVSAALERRRKRKSS
jgi:UDP-N-acetylmuramoyl-L-alanyl-D-glutamate--2,6-diaminopimelate ligase